MSGDDTLRAMRRLIVQAAARHTRVASEAEDLAHDLIVAALGRGVPLTGDVFLRSAHGSARRHGAFLARSAARRRARELRAAVELLPSAPEPHADDGPTWSAPPGLSPTLETTLLLLLAGHDKRELRALLAVSDTALRKRFEALRRLGPLTRPRSRSAPRSLALVRLRRSQIALLRRLLAPPPDTAAPGRPFAVGDPDGHGLIFTERLTSGTVTATRGEHRPEPAAPEKGTPC